MVWLGSENKKRSERAVSPVIGVMLMLIVTVLLAAAVSSFTGGLKTQKAAPSAKFDVKIVVKGSSEGMSNGWVTYMQLKEISGDTIPSKDLEIITYNPDAVGNKYVTITPNNNNTWVYENATAASWYGEVTEYGTLGVRFVYNNTIYNQYNKSIELVNGTNSKATTLYVYCGPQIGTSPYLNDMSEGSFTPGFFGAPNATLKFYLYNKTGSEISSLTVTSYNFTENSLNVSSLGINVSNVSYVREVITYHNEIYNPKVSFGNYAISPGVTLTADWWYNYVQSSWNGTSSSYEKVPYLDHSSITGFCACIADGWNVTPGHYITVKIVYTPTHTVIWEKKVLVRGEGVW